MLTSFTKSVLLSLGATLVGFPGTGDVGRAAPARYVAGTAEGDRHEGNQLQGWGLGDASLSLDGKPLLSDSPPVSWILDRQAPPPTVPTSYVEFHGGDRLPGEVHSYHSRGQGPPHYLVGTSSTMSAAEVRVVARFARRLVWRRLRQDRYRPNYVFLRDGRGLQYRSLRLGAEGVELLLADSQAAFSFDEIAELHLPAWDAWEAYLANAAILCSGTQTRLHQLETPAGHRVTCSAERRETTATREDDADTWRHTVQPAWSLDPLVIQQSQVRTHRFWILHQVPLTWFDPHSSVSNYWPWRRNLTSQAMPLTSPAGSFGWGFGVGGRSELHFLLPRVAKGFDSFAALDLAPLPSLTRVEVEPEGTGDSHKISADQPLVRHRLQWPDEELPSRRELVMKAEPGALNVGKSLHWGDPLLRFDVAELEQLIADRVPTSVHAWAGWNLVTPANALRRANVQIGELERGGSFRWSVSAGRAGMTLRRTASLSPTDRWLVVDAVRGQPGESPSHLEVYANGESLGRQPLSSVPEAAFVARRPCVFSLNSLARDESVRFELRQGGGDSDDVLWQSIYFTEHHPAGLEIFTDLSPQLIDSPDSYRGSRCLRVGEQPIRFRWEQPIAIRERPAPGQYRFLRFAVRTVENGQLRIKLTGFDADAGYLIGAAGEAEARPVADPPSDRWITVTRDLFGDFGEGEISEVEMVAPGGRYLVDEAAALRELRVERLRVKS